MDLNFQWHQHVTRRNKKNMIRAVLEWKPTGKRFCGRPRKIRYTVEALKKIRVQEWITIVHNREEYRL